MAKQRYINTRFWDDNYIASLDPIEKLLFIYFLTNPLTEISGAYEIPLKRVALDTGIDRDMVQKILNRFADEDKIIYREGWILVTNFIKHQSVNPKIATGIESAVKRCPEWIQDRLSIAYDSLSHLNLSYSNLSNSILSGVTHDVTECHEESHSVTTEEQTTKSVNEFQGRRGIPRTMIPINPSSDLKLQTWLGASAAAFGVKNAQSLPKFDKWEKACMTLVTEDGDMARWLDTIKSEKERLADTPHFFSADNCLKVYQVNGTKKPVESYNHVRNQPTQRQAIAEEQERVAREIEGVQ